MLKKFLLIPVFAMMCVFGSIMTASAVDYVFSVTTESIATNTTFQFKLAGKGTFYVDCGTGGTLVNSSGNTISTITKTTTSQFTYGCKYSSDGVKTIRFGSENVTSHTSSYPAISFNTTTAQASLKSISGSLSSLFPPLGSGVTKIPNFYQTFYGCTHLTSIPANLFSGYTSSVTKMFKQTFKGCTGITSIPEGLFDFGGNNVSGQETMFNETFYGCTGLTSIPANLFHSLTSGAAHMFSGTFQGCTGITSIPEGLFDFGGNNVSGKGSMFNSTFYGCTGLTSIPATLFSRVASSAEFLFSYTFAFTGITSIPATLFSRVTSGARSMFAVTFQGCTGLTSIPATLFSSVTSSADNMFHQTFQNCTGLDGYIPATLFSGLATQSTPPDATDFMTDIFNGCTNLDESCPSGTTRYTTAYDSYWSSKVSCVPVINLNFDGTSGGTCNFGGTFIPPTPAARVGQVFKGWKIQTQ